MLFNLLKSAIDKILDSLDYKNEYGTICYTIKGEKVKSKGEKMIADYFHQNNIEYEYEKDAKTNGWIFHDKISKPDFYLSAYKVYVEYWGLVNAQNRRVKAEYVRIMKWKMAQYRKNKIKFVSIYPDNLSNLDWIFRAKFKEETGIELRQNTGKTEQK